MSLRLLSILTSTCLLALGVSQSRAQATMSPQLRGDTGKAIEHGLAFLRTRQAANGSWSKSVGVTALDVRGFLESPNGPAKQDGPLVARSIAFILGKRHPDGSISEAHVNSGYNTSTSLLALAATRDPKYRPVIEAGQAYLKHIQIGESEGYGPDKPWYGGIGYSDDDRPDMSNQYLALQALKATALDPKDPVWQRALKFVNRSQNRSESNDQKWAGNDGGFIYMPGMNTAPFKGTESYGTMTSAGLVSLLYAGVDRKDPRVQDAFKWIRNHYTLDVVPGTERKDGIYYFYYAFAYCMGAYGDATVTDGKGRPHNWREDLARKLLALQRPDGSWINTDSSMWWQDNPDLVTAFSVNALNQTLK
ncbi:MAG: terpene cyclase/mutase family protein [Proteobacteria bacterium]|nr:terpene cyclase/mutase family protein [Pseudomonadota bacterium]